MNRKVLRLSSNLDVNTFQVFSGKFWEMISWEKILNNINNIEEIKRRYTMEAYGEAYRFENKAKERAYFDYQVLPIFLKYFSKEIIIGHHSYVHDCCTLWGIYTEIPDQDIQKMEKLGAEIVETLENIISWEIWDY